VDESWTCGECGWTNRGGRFCFECGRDGFPDPVATQRLAPQPGRDEPRWRRPALIGAAIALLAALAAVTAMLVSGGDSPKAAGTPARAAPVASSRLTRAQTLDELMKIVVASRAGLAATRKGEWAQAAQNRRGLVGRLAVLETRTGEVKAARTALARALRASERANAKSLACKDAGTVSACAAPAHRLATTLKERFRRAFNKLLAADRRKPVAPQSF
jgi:hypothetical protein